ncbi:unnamed protein product [Adineta steineri]|uniref:F-box domain-containing protein n=1 Tax=Adineta steineri TaxID=433720 RepID=A0A816FPE9_9BILA|nr:unnamed protein product [Adineta steineri]CAF1559098.1 unnamed protein product [Adineta steineri]CAF1664137.1 unnamed protein product [Adineta steineri]CAF1664142.1 unnamed protein product [Adineta steineri]
MQNFRNHIQNFSTELLLEIFDYLSINDCFNAFYNLNKKMNSALYISGYSIDLTVISRQKFYEFYQNIIFPNYSQQIRKLKISNDLTIGLLDKFFNEYYLRDFIQLRSLTLINKPSYIILGSIALLIPHLKQLEHISIDSNSYPDSFFEKITTKSSTIKSCYLPGLQIQDNFTFESKITYLTVTVEDITILWNLLARFSQLKYLNVFLRSTVDANEECLPKLNVISCNNLQIFKLHILEQSSIEFNEIEYLFQRILFPDLISFSYDCVTNSLDHFNVTHWNDILSKYLSTIKKFVLLVQIPYKLPVYINIKEALIDMQKNLHTPIPFSLSIDYEYYMIHTDIYPKKNFNLSLKPPNLNLYSNNYDPINCDIIEKYSKVNSLILDCNSILPCMILSKNIQYLQIQGYNDNLNLSKSLKDCSNQLLSLKICGLPNDLPHMSNLRQLTIQQIMFDLKMVSKLEFICPHLELLTIEIDCIQQFGNILDQLRYKSNLTELKFIRAFSRDPIQTWSSWLNERKQIIPSDNNIAYEAKNSYLFIWF